MCNNTDGALGFVFGSRWATSVGQIYCLKDRFVPRDVSQAARRDALWSSFQKYSGVSV